MQIKVLIVDDSALMRRHLKNLFEQAGFVTAMARNGQDCLTQLNSFKPDVITLDINMPIMDGIECLKTIMKTQPLPVVMVSSLTEDGAEATFKALALGAVDFIQKPSGTWTQNMGESAPILLEKVRQASKVSLQKLKASNSTSSASNNSTNTLRQLNSTSFFGKPKLRVNSQNTQAPSERQSLSRRRFGAINELIVIGVSTGGPNCLQAILPKLKAEFSTPIVVAQHMPARFTKVFAERLNTMCALSVVEVDSKQPLLAHHIYIAKGDADIVISKMGGRLYAESVPITPEYIWHPSVTRLVETACENVDVSKLCCVQLTGMGNDGAQAMKTAHEQGATVIAESNETAVVFGMPGELVKLEGTTKILPNHAIANALQ